MMKANSAFHAGLFLVAFWTAPAFAQTPFEGVWFAFDPNDGSEGWIAVDSRQHFIFFDTDAQGGCSQTGGGPFLGSAKKSVITGDRLSGTVDGLCQADKKGLSFSMTLNYLAATDEIFTRGAAFFRVANLDGDSFVAGALQLKTVSPKGWRFVDVVLKGHPVQAPPPGPGIGADCTSPPTIHPGADLANCDLSGLILDGVDLTSANLSGANLTGTALSGSTLADADLRGATIVSTNLSRANLTGANLFGTDMLAGDLSEAVLIGADLRSSLWDGVELDRTNFTAADLSDAVLWGRGVGFGYGLNIFRSATLRNIIVREMDLVSSSFTGADLSNASFDTVLLSGSLFDNAILVDASFDYADFGAVPTFAGANLLRASFNYSPMAEAHFHDAILVDAVFRNSALELSPNFSGTNMLGAVFESSPITDAIWFNTICPDGTNSDDTAGDPFPLTCLDHF